MNKSVLLIALMLAPLSGCLGIPEGAIGPGDTVQAVVMVTDANTGEVLQQTSSVNFVVGSGDAGLGYGFERQIVGEPTDFSGTLTVTGDPSLQWGGTVETEARFVSDLVQTVPTQQFTSAFGEPVAGDTFAPPNSFFDYEVVAVEGDVVYYQPLPEQGQRDPVPGVGAILVTSVDGDQLIQVLEPDVGATFRILPPSPFNPNTPLGLEPGSYRTVSGDGETIVYEHSAATNPDLVGHDLRIEVAIQQVNKASASAGPQPVDGNYGVRQSPYINGAPSSTIDFGPLSGEAGDHADDGHTH